MIDKKKVAREQIIRELYFHNSLSCAELSQKIKKSLPVTTKILNGLLDEGHLRENGFAPSTGGRRPNTYSVNMDLCYMICVALDQFVARIALVDMENNFVFPPEKFDLQLPKNQSAVDELISALTGFIDRLDISKDKILGIGIGMPGFVDSEKGVNYSFLHTDGRPISSILRKATDLPVYIDNDSSLVALAELRFGAAMDKKNVMVVNIGWGLGLGMILNGELFRGHDGFAGEFSHLPVFSNGKLCSCGKTGCLETETSLLVMIDNARQGLKEGRTSLAESDVLEQYEHAIEAILQAVHAGDRFTVELFSQIGYNIGRGVAILMHLLNPELIVLSGRGSLAGKVWLPPIQQALNEHCIPRIAANTHLQLSTLGYNAELVGAAALVMDHFESEAFNRIFRPATVTA